jgi:hypothetical protein
MNQHDPSETAVIMTKGEARNLAATGTRKTRRKYFGIPASIVALFAVLAVGSGVAYAAITIFFSGSATAEAYVTKTPVISAAHFTGQLYPGAVSNLKFTVTNENPFPVKITSVAATSASNFTGGCANGANLTGPVSSLNQNLAVNAVVPANGSKIVEVPNAITLSNAATAGCSFKVEFKVTASGAANAGE